jgi:hypothetical protein
MSRRLTRAVVVFLVVFAAAQLVRPERANPATDASRARVLANGVRRD